MKLANTNIRIEATGTSRRTYVSTDKHLSGNALALSGAPDVPYVKPNKETLICSVVDDGLPSDPPADVRYRQWLKSGKRRFKLRCTDVTIGNSPERASVTATSAQTHPEPTSNQIPLPRPKRRKDSPNA